MKEKLGMIDQGIIAMFQPKEYKRLREQKIGRTAGYILSLLILVTVIRYVIPMSAQIAGLGGISNIIQNRMPQFSLQNGILTVDGRYENAEPEYGRYILVDTEKERFDKSDIEVDYLQVVLVSATNVIMKNMILTEEYKWNDIIRTDLDNAKLGRYAYVFYLMFILFFIFLFLLTAAGYFFLSLLFAWIANTLSKVMLLPLSFGQIYKMALYAQSIGALVTAVAYCLESPLMIMASGIFSMIVTFNILNKALLQERQI